ILSEKPLSPVLGGEGACRTDSKMRLPKVGSDGLTVKLSAPTSVLFSRCAEWPAPDWHRIRPVLTEGQSVHTFPRARRAARGLPGSPCYAGETSGVRANPWRRTNPHWAYQCRSTGHLARASLQSIRG